MLCFDDTILEVICVGKNSKRIVLDKEVNDMSAMVIERASLKSFIEQNKSKIYNMAEKNTVRNSKGQTTISRTDPDFNEDEWEEHFKKNC